MNVHVRAMSDGRSLTFLHAIEDGPTNDSFRDQVAALAGLPNHVIERSMDLQAFLEDRSLAHELVRKEHRTAVIPLNGPSSDSMLLLRRRWKLAPVPSTSMRCHQDEPSRHCMSSSRAWRTPHEFEDQ